MFPIMFEISLAQQSEELNPVLESLQHNTLLTKYVWGIRKCLERITSKTLMPVNIKTGGPQRENLKVLCAEPPWLSRKKTARSPEKTK